MAQRLNQQHNSNRDHAGVHVTQERIAAHAMIQPPADEANLDP